MDFSLNDEQKQLSDSVGKFVKGSYDFEKRRQIIKKHDSLDPAIWQQFADLGWLSLPFAEDDGGIGGTLIDTMVLLEECGKGLVVEPFIPTVVLGGGFIRRGTPAQKSRYLPALMAGTLQAAFAVQEYEQVFSLAGTATTATADGDCHVLNGHKSVVLNGDRAGVCVVLARTAGRPGEEDGLTLFLVDTDTHGVQRTGHRLLDNTRAADIRFDNVRIANENILGELHQGAVLAATVINEAILALAAEATGILSVLLYSTVEYTKTRKQFGVAIGSFQVLQHRMTNMFIAYEQTRSLLLCATLKVHEGHRDAGQAVHALKAQLGRAGRLLGQEAIQLHGGMGMTDEMPIGHYFKRITAIDALFGNADQHTRAFAA